MILSLLLVLATESQGRDLPPLDVDAILTAMNANRAIFQDHHFRYKFTVGEARSAQEVDSGKWERLITAEGRFATKGNHVFQSLLLDAAEEAAVMRRPGMVTKNPDGSVGIRRLAASFWLLDNGRCTLYVRGRELNHSAHAEAEPFRKLRQRFGPIDLGVMGENERGSPQVRLSNDWKGKRGVQWRSAVRRFGGEDADVQATFINANGKPDNRYWFNSKKGYVLIRLESFFGQDTPEQGLAAKKVVQDSKGGWFIEEAVSYAYVAKESNFIVREYKVLSVEPDPPESCFAITLEAGTRIMHDDLNFPYLRLPERRTIAFQNLPSLVRGAEEAKQKRSKAAQERAERAMADLPQAQSGQSRTWIWGVLLLACAGVFFGLSFRRRSGALEG